VHTLSASFILGYHGCDHSVGERLLLNEPFESSSNDYDWLGSGVYFWEANPRRALDWANELKRRRPDLIGDPFVVGAVIDLGYCLDLASTEGIEYVRAAHDRYREEVTFAGTTLPLNRGGDDLLLRHLDCAVINYIHQINDATLRPAFETVRGVFLEGKRIYETSGFFEKTHIQICVRNLKNIKAVFRVPAD
jgi:hypothetical protein